ncbi:MAG: UDP-N-acetylmuramoyl-tripeptide--D-alanyl-D-alanine ligase [Syntrophomonas sp.]|nr:UDP-N-acetylmuramoyl-tripeptide--D-alanyl-D-alanine ligase [Syntrophomonas sp.]
MKTLVLRKPVIAVTGSSGKTTTKEMIASVLQRRWKVYKSAENRNNRAHLRHHAKKIRSSHQAIVLEYGMSARGHLRRSCKIIKPNMAVITMIGTAHIGNVGGTVEGLIQAKSELILNMNQTGTLFLNADDENSKRLNTRTFQGIIVKVGINNKADYQALDVRSTQQGMNFGVKLLGTYHEFFIPILGTHNVYNALFAMAVADRLGFSPEQIKEGLENYRRPGRRLRVYHRENSVCLIDDTFNANPNSVKAAIDVLTTISKENNIAVLGSMSELGRYSRRGHKEVGRYLADKNITYLFTYGTGAKIIGKAAISNGFPSARVIHSISRNTLHKRLKRTINPGSTVLVKGSHNMMMNKTVRFLKSGT